VALEAMRIASLRAQLAAVAEIVDDDQRVLDMVRKAQAAGGESRAAIPGGMAQIAEDQALAPPLQRQLDASRHRLALLVGKSPAEWSAPDFDISTLTGATDIPVSLPSTLVRSRPDILAAEAELHAATAEIGMAVANQYPDIRISGAFTQSSVKTSNLFSYASSGWNIGPGVTVPIFNRGRLKAERRVAGAEARAAMARYQQTVLRAFVQVSDVLSALAQDQLSIAALQRSADASGANARNMQNAYRLGGEPLVNVITAQRSYSRARRALVQAQGLRYADMVELYTATAADWRLPETGA
jgi:NodT family efflux transporter outer membrane factor (OMF) lipoprotein